MRISWKDHVKNESVLKRANVRRLSEIVAERRLRFAGHILRMSNSRHAYTAFNWTPVGGNRKRGRPRTTWRNTFKNDLHSMGIEWREAEIKASDRVGWRRLTALYSDRSRRT